MTGKTQDHSLVILRAALGVIFFAHGSQKLLGWFGGYGFDATVQFFQQALGVPSALTMLVMLGEFFGGILLLFGLLTRAAAAWIAIIMTYALLTVHLPQGFFIAGDRVGFEYVFALLAMSLYLVVNGSGGLSADGFIRDKISDGAFKRILS